MERETLVLPSPGLVSPLPPRPPPPRLSDPSPPPAPGRLKTNQDQAEEQGLNLPRPIPARFEEEEGTGKAGARSVLVFRKSNLARHQRELLSPSVFALNHLDRRENGVKRLVVLLALFFVLIPEDNCRFV